MTALAKVRITVDDFLVWYEKQAGRYELVGGYIVAQQSERARHNLVKIQAVTVLQDAVRRAGLPCTVFTDGMGIKIDDAHWREPDAVVQCNVTINLDSIFLDNPIIVVEVISPSSERDDTGAKLVEYFSVPSIQHYLIVNADKRVVIHHARAGTGDIKTRIVPDGDLILDPPGLTISAASLFDIGVADDRPAAF